VTFKNEEKDDMPAPLNIRDIGEARKAALEAEAKATGASISDIVRDWIDAGLSRSRAERERAEWIAAAEAGLADEARHLELNGPTLARFRKISATSP
jgi:plasmid stability protein